MNFQKLDYFEKGLNTRKKLGKYFEKNPAIFFSEDLLDTYFWLVCMDCYG